MHNWQYFQIPQTPMLGLSLFEKEDLIKFGYPIDIQKCMKHRKANLICKDIGESLWQKRNQRQICQCCRRIVGDQPSKTLCVQNKIYAQYGPGIPLYFFIFKYIIYLLVAQSIIFGIYGFISNILSHDCQRLKRCWSNTFSMKISFLNSYEQPHVTQIQLTLINVIIALQIVAFLYIRYKLKYEKRQFDEALVSPSDFAMIVRRLPQNVSKKDIYLMVELARAYLSPQQLIQTNNLKIHKILFCYNLQDYLLEEKLNLQNFKKSCKDDSQFLKIQTSQMGQRVSSCIVIFQKQRSKNLMTKHISFLEKIKRQFWLAYQPLSSLAKVKDQYVNVQRAPQPDDIIWQNQGVKIKDLLYKRITIFLLSVNLLLISATFQYYLATLRKNYELDDERTQKLFSLASAGLITLINFVIEIVLVLSSKFQKPTSQTLLRISMTSKIVILQFINSGLISILINVISFISEFRYHKTLICSDIIYIMMMNVVFNNAFNFCWVFLQIPNVFARWKLMRKQCTYTQLQANKIFQANIVDIEYKYAYIFKTLWLTAFFMPTEPSVVFLSILALTINYWTEKYLFSAFYSIPQMFSGRIIISVLDLLNYCCLWLILGSLFIHSLRVNFNLYRLPNQHLFGHFLGILLSLFVIFAPLSELSKKLFGDQYKKKIWNQSYQQVEQMFQIKYQDTNPKYKSGQPKEIMWDIQGLNLMLNVINNPDSALF